MIFKRWFVGLSCAIAIAGTGLNVQALDSVSGGNLSVSGGDAVGYNSDFPFGDFSGVSYDMLVNALNEVVPMSSYSTYYGAIGSTYVDYMRGYLSKLDYDAHYVGARVGQYDYIFAYGSDLFYSSGVFSGSVTVVRWNTYNNGSFSVSYDNSFRLSAGSYLVYSDLSSEYPSLATSSDFTLRQILYSFTIFCIFMLVDHMYQVRKIRRLERKDRI